jgi:outer membrane protein assembly factor BamE (lipoprotein component of BamABCDE complex)
MTRTATSAVRLMVALWAGLAAGCASGLHPHTTLAGRHFPNSRAAELRQGQTHDEVKAILGDPFEVAEAGESTVWRYYERAIPRGCTSYLFGLSLGNRPEWLDEVIVTFRFDRVASLKVRQQRDDVASKWEAPQNNELQRTRPAQTREPRR